MPDAINSTINATAPPPVPTPERGPVTSSGVRTIMHPFRAWSPLCPLSRNSTCVTRRRSKNVNCCLPEKKATSRRVRQCIECAILASLAKISSDLAARKYPNARHIHSTPPTPPPAPHDGSKHLPANRTSHEMERRTRRGVPATTCEFAMPRNTRLIKDELIGSSRPASLLWKNCIVVSLPEIVPT